MSATLQLIFASAVAAAPRPSAQNWMFRKVEHGRLTTNPEDEVGKRTLSQKNGVAKAGVPQAQSPRCATGLEPSRASCNSADRGCEDGVVATFRRILLLSRPEPKLMTPLKHPR
jgi:hypothetical protein